MYIYIDIYIYITTKNNNNNINGKNGNSNERKRSYCLKEILFVVCKFHIICMDIQRVSYFCFLI